MAVCEFCGLERQEAASCMGQSVLIGFREYPPIPFGQEPHVEHGEERCPDCHVAKGGYHHPGCSMEACPRCYDQLISCGCVDEI